MASSGYPIQNGLSLVKEMAEAYQQGYTSWSTAWAQMKIDVLHALVSWALPAKWRDRWQWASLGLEADCVWRNYRMGIGVKW